MPLPSPWWELPREHRVVVRRRLTSAQPWRYTDVKGLVVAANQEGLTIIPEHGGAAALPGDTMAIPAAQIVAARAIPPRPAPRQRLGAQASGGQSND